MGCGNAKEKLEDEMMKAKMERIEIQFERQKQMNLLKELGGGNYKPPVIPDYTYPHIEMDKQDKQPTVRKRKTVQLTKPKTIRLRPTRSQSFAHKKKTSIDREDTYTESKTKGRKSLKRKTLKI